MIVYIEYVLIDNFIIDYLMLKATFTLTGMPVKKRRLFLCAFLGAVVALIYPLMQSLGLLSTMLKVFTGLLIVLIANQYSNLKSFYINSTIFFLHTFLTGGIILGVSSLLNINLSTEVSSAFMVVPVYLILRGLGEVVKYFFERKNVQNFIYKTRLTIFNKSLEVRGFLDTGNALTDNGKPVIVCDKRLFIKLVGQNITKVRLNKLEVITANGKSQNYAFIVDEVALYIDQKVNIFNKVTVCLSSQSLGDDFDIILHPKLLESEYANKTDIIYQKTS